MKKFAILGAVAVLATAGSVFAGWTFSESNYEADKFMTVSIGIDSYDLTGKFGFMFTTKDNLELQIYNPAPTTNLIGIKATNEGTSEFTVGYQSLTPYVLEKVEIHFYLQYTLHQHF